MKKPVDPLDNAGHVFTVSAPYAPAAVTSVKATPSLVSAACHAAVVGSDDPPPITRTFKSNVGDVAARAIGDDTAN